MQAGGTAIDIETVKSQLNQHHFRMTQEREVVLDTFMHCGKMLTPAQLHRLVQSPQSRVGLTTVYRLLEVLTKLGMTTPFLLDGEICYTFCSGEHHHHFICLECRRVQEMFTCPEIDTPSEYGTVSRHQLDLFGRCRHCDSSPQRDSVDDGKYAPC